MKRGLGRVRVWLAVASVLMLVAAACSKGGGGSSASTQPTVFKYDASAQGEGQLNLIAWPYYTEKAIRQEFEQETGCQINPVKYANTSDEMVNLMRLQGGTLYDGVSASGDATRRLIGNGDVAPVDVTSFPEYGNVMQSLQAPAHNTTNGVHYGVPYEWGPNILMFNTDVVKPAPTSWATVFDPNSPYAGKITVYDSPIYIADAAMYLMNHQPDLGIRDPYELTQTQLEAAVAVLKGQKPNVKKYWSLAADEIDLFTSGELVVGTAWPYQVSVLQSDNQPVDATIPSEGATGWADTWMMSKNAQHPNCMYKWMDWASTPEVQAQVAEFYGATPSNTKSCDIITADLGAKAAEPYHCGDDAFVHQLFLWKTPLADCGDGKNDCVDYSVWQQKWTEIKG
jgi:putative spermidine/putrescine transport system substrate-binding protein